MTEELDRPMDVTADDPTDELLPADDGAPPPIPGNAGDASLLGLGVALGYLTLGWAIAGWTVGGAVLGLRVVRRRGGRLGWARSAARAVLCVVVPLGLLWAAVSVTRRSLQDLLVGSAVVYAEHPAPEGARSR